MHAGFPCFPREMNGLLKLGAIHAKVDGLLDRAGGTLVARGMAMLLKAGFCLVMRYGWSREQARKAEEFFRENFEITDAEAPNGIRYYRGKILVRTDRPEDDMNVYLRFCPDPETVFTKGTRGLVKKALFGTALDSSAVVSTDVLNEKEAERLQRDPEKVDLVISFKDVKSIVSLIGRPQVEMGSLLMENVVRMNGNVGHLFKVGAIAKNVELALTPEMSQRWMKKR